MLAHPHVWAVRFHSEMCLTCKGFAPAWNEATEAVGGLHFGSVNVDKRENVALAKKLGVLKEGIPNVKLMCARRPPPFERTACARVHGPRR